MMPSQLEEGYWSAYRNFYRWRNILKGANTKPTFIGAVRHAAYSAGRKKFEPLWNLLIRAKHVARMRPALESILRSFGRLNPESGEELIDTLPATNEGTNAETLLQIH